MTEDLHALAYMVGSNIHRMYDGKQTFCKSISNFRNSKNVFRNYVFYVRDKCNCRMCGSEAWNVHHILPRRDYPHLENETCNMISLCKSCHYLADENFITTEKLFSLI